MNWGGSTEGGEGLRRPLFSPAPAPALKHVRLLAMLFRKTFSMCRLSLFAGSIAIACAACGPSPEANTAYAVAAPGGEEVAAYPVQPGQTVYVYIGDEPEAPPKAAPPPAVVAAPPAVPANPFVQTRLWSGEYFCPQGMTNMTLRVTRVDGDEIDAVYAFRHIESGAAGSYRTRGHFDVSTRTVTFSPGSWISRPPNYVTVGMEGRVADDGSMFAGRITHPRCGMFSLTPGRS